MSTMYTMSPECVIEMIRGALRRDGCAIGWMTVLNEQPRQTATMAYAVCRATGERWCVVSTNDQNAWLELAQQVADSMEDPTPIAQE